MPPELVLLAAGALFVLGARCGSSSSFGKELLQNRGFESGSLAPWELEAGGCTPAAAGEVAGAAPQAGVFFLHGGSDGAPLCRVAQEVDLLARGFGINALDQKRAAATGSVWLRGARNAGKFDDQSFYRVRFLDETRDELASLRSLIGGDVEWIERDFLGLLPPGTRHLRLELDARLRRDDLSNDGMADEASTRIVGVANASPLMTKQPVLQDVRPDAMTILWETDANLATHAVEWGPAGSGLTQAETRVETTRVTLDRYVHKAVLLGLTAQTEYDYRVRSGTEVSPAYRFRTAPLPASPFRVAWVADNQDGAGVFAQHVAHMAAREPDLVIAPGDVVQQGGNLAHWDDQWFGPLETLAFGQTTPLVIARGNHDREHAYSYAYTALPANEAWYAFPYGNTFFVVLDTEVVSASQLAFLQTALVSPEAAAAEFRIVVFHKPPYTDLWDSPNYNGEGWVRNAWVPLFEAAGVDLVVSGHAHAYERGTRNGVTYVVVGGGGGALDTFTPSAPWGFFDVLRSEWHYVVMDVAGTTLSWTAYDLSDGALDAFQIVH